MTKLDIRGLLFLAGLAAFYFSPAEIRVWIWWALFYLAGTSLIQALTLRWEEEHDQKSDS